MGDAGKNSESLHRSVAYHGWIPLFDEVIPMGRRVLIDGVAAVIVAVSRNVRATRPAAPAK